MPGKTAPGNPVTQAPERFGLFILVLAAALAAALVLAGVIYGLGTGHRSAVAAAQAGCEPGLTSEAQPCVTQPQLASEYSAAINPAGRQLSIDITAYASSERGNLAAARAALTAQAQVEQALAIRLAGIQVPASMTAQLTALIQADQARAKLTAAQAKASSLHLMRSLDSKTKLAAAAMQIQVKLMQQEVNKPAAAS